jgi:methionyl-tRNA formyltransferase
VLVVTRPDRPRGRGRHLSPPPVAEAARALGIELFQPASVNDDDARASIAAAHPDVVCVCAFGALIKEPLLSDYEMLNVHPSLLPRWRGAAPIERAIMAGDAETGVSIMRVTAGLDSGPVCLQAAEPIETTDTYGTLSARLERIGGELLVRALDERPPFREQAEEGATYAQKLEPGDRRLDPDRPASELDRVVRALTPHVGAYVELADGERLGVKEVAVVPDGPPAGTLSLDGPRPVLGCAVGALELLVVQPAGRRAMAGEDYLRGLR